MSLDNLQARRSRPSQLQTSIPPQSQVAAAPPSAVSILTAASSSRIESPVLSAGPVSILNGGEMQPSPEPLRGRDMAPNPPPLLLPDGLISRKTSNNSLTYGTVTSPGSYTQEQPRAPGMMRRFSNRVTQFTGSMGSALGTSTRRQSSAHANSRDGSVGPSVIRSRLRSNSNTSQLPIARQDSCAFYSDSEDEFVNEIDNGPSSLDGGDFSSIPDFSPLTTAGSISGTSSPATISAGPVIPQSLLNGTWLLKLSKLKKPKRIFMVLDPDLAKIYWDKTRPNKSIHLDDIKEVRVKDDLRQYRREFNAPDSYETLGLSLIVAGSDRGKYRMVHLVAENEQSHDEWITAIETIKDSREGFVASLMAFDDEAVLTYWDNEMSKKVDSEGRCVPHMRIDQAFFASLCKNLHIHVPASTLNERFNEAMAMNQDCKGDGRLDRRGFLAFVQSLKMRSDLQPIYRKYASDPECGLTLEDFFLFLRESQAEDVDQNVGYWTSVFGTLLRKSKLAAVEQVLGDKLRLSEGAFASYFTSIANVLLRKESKPPVLDRPINEYYISSSHNTYLLGRQVAGISSIEGYISALIRGCRCVEIDCWDGPNDEPMVMHGHTFTTQISFREVCNTINKYAFVKSPYPLYLSLEVRCNLKVQENMTRIMFEIFGDKLLVAPLENCTDRMPSPDMLMHRILIKVKKPQLGDELRRGSDIIGRRRGNSLTSPHQRPANVESGSLPGSPLLSPLGNGTRKTSTKLNTLSEDQVPEEQSNSPSENESDSDKDSVKRTANKINPILGSLGIYSAGIHFGGFDTPEAREFNHIFSFKESTFAKNSIPGEKKRALFRHNMRHLMRVYPNGSRINSGNFLPHIYWKRGVQMAALNWQTFDLGMQINQAMFEAGVGQTGYVLKSEGLREFKHVTDNPETWATKRERKIVKLTVDVISAQQLLRPSTLRDKRSLDPYVEVELLLADDKQHKGDSNGNNPKENALRLRTKIIKGNGFNPEFRDTLEFPDVQTKYPDLVFVRWIVRLADRNVPSDRAPILAVYTAKLDHLKKGYRTLPLLDQNGDRYLFSTLFCKINYDITTRFVPAPTDDAKSTNNRFRAPFLSRSNLSPKNSNDNVS